MNPISPLDHPDAGPVLTSLARGAIANALHLPATPPATDAWLAAPGASFVTLTIDAQLRGCIGSLQAWRPLREDVQDNARSAAVHDPRFPPLSAKELPMVAIEVSLLSPSEPIEFTSREDALTQLNPGEDGVILAVGGRRATFLPQVWDELPDPGQFISHLLRKAGLTDSYWSDAVQLSRYRVIAFQEAAG